MHTVAMVTPKKKGGYTLVELIVSLGIFSIVVLLASGAYFMMISSTRRIQATATGINNLSFAMETMTRMIRTGTNYNCAGVGDCTRATLFSFVNMNNQAVTYSLSGGAIQETIAGVSRPLTDPVVQISTLHFNASGTSGSDMQQAAVTIVVSGTVPDGRGGTIPFTVQTGATMRGSDI